MTPQSHYITTDLCLYTKVDPTRLVEEFAPACYADTDKVGNLFRTNFGLDRGGNSVDSTLDITAYLDLLEAMSPEAREIWRGATRRELSIGWASAAQRPEGSLDLEPAILKRLADFAVLLNVTIYPSDENDED